MKRLSLAGALLLMYLFAGCTPSPEPISYGQDQCSHCMMSIVEPKYASELLTRKGKVYKFDAIECLAAFYEQADVVPKDQVYAVLVSDFYAPANFIDATQATYLHSDNIHSPMSMNLAAFATPEGARKAQETFTGEFMTWQDVLQRVRAEWLKEKAGRKKSM